MIAKYRNPNAKGSGLGAALQWDTASGLWTNDRGGLGAYPTDAYFDKDRPGWLPYWVDTPTESARKYNATNLIDATVNAAGMAVSYAVPAAANVVGNAVGTTAGAVANSAGLGGSVLLYAGAALALGLLLGKGRR